MLAWLAQRRVRIAVAAGVIGLYLVLALWVSFAKAPWSDEGSFASPAYNLAFHGFTGTTIVDEQSSGLAGIHAHTYWNPPLGMLVQAGAFRLLGFHLVVMRLPSIVMGLVAALSWFVIVRRLTGRTGLAYAAMTIILCDYTFVMAASLARYDMLCAGFGAAGLALYLSLRDRSMAWALVAANAAIAAAGLSHPLGILYLLGLLVLVVRDRHRLDVRTVLLATVPYLLGGIAWGLYILQDPASFAIQFHQNLTAGDRGHALSLTNPVATLWSELDGRYLRAFGLKDHTPGNAGPLFLKAFILAVYFAAAIAAFALRGVRRQRGFRTLAILLGVFFLFLTLGEGQRGAVYLVHVMPLYACLLAFVAGELLARRGFWASGTAAVLAAFVALQLGGTVERAAQNTYARRYLPALAYVRAQAGRDELVMGSVAAVFALAPDRDFRADNRLGFYSGDEPAWIVVDDFLRESFALDRARNPEIARHLDAVLARHPKVFSSGGTDVYGPPAGPRAGEVR
ncbi:MAG: ArnT family glycosyltransferase [Acidobacteriota bacterium]